MYLKNCFFSLSARFFFFGAILKFIYLLICRLSIPILLKFLVNNIEAKTLGKVWHYVLYCRDRNGRTHFTGNVLKRKDFSSLLGSVVTMPMLTPWYDILENIGRYIAFVFWLARGAIMVRSPSRNPINKFANLVHHNKDHVILNIHCLIFLKIINVIYTYNVDIIYYFLHLWRVVSVFFFIFCNTYMKINNKIFSFFIDNLFNMLNKNSESSFFNCRKIQVA